MTSCLLHQTLPPFTSDLSYRLRGLSESLLKVTLRESRQEGQVRNRGMHMGHDDHDDWHVEISQPFLFNAPGEGARRKEQELAAGKGSVRRLAERLLDVRSDERNWRKGAEGEEEVGRRLAKLPTDRWAVVHDLTIGTRGANLDHLVVGPPGVFTLNTKHLTGKVTLYRRALLQNGHKTRYLPEARREAERVQQRLTDALGRPVHVWPIIVLMGCELDEKERPDDVSVIGRRWLPKWFLKLPTQRLPFGEVLEIERAARSAATWQPQPRTSPTARSGPARPAPAPVPAAPPPAKTSPADPVDGLTVNRWRRFGHDRLYVNTVAGESLGYLDVATGTVHVTDETNRRIVEARVASERPMP